MREKITFTDRLRERGFVDSGIHRLRASWVRRLSGQGLKVSARGWQWAPAQ